MVALYPRGNEAVAINAATDVDFAITEHGSDWLWAAFSLFSLATLAGVCFSFTKKEKRERIFYHSTSLSLFFMAITYFTMASNLGYAPVTAEFNHVTVSNQTEYPGIRQIFYARYIGWFLAFPALFLNFATLFSVNWSSTLFTILCQETTVITYLIGSLISSTYKWGYFTFGSVALLFVFAEFIFTFRPSAQSVGYGKTANIVLPLSSLLLLLYPVAWGLSDGANVIQPDSGAVFFGVLDVCLFIFVGTLFLYLANGVDFRSQGITVHDKPVFHDDVHPSTTQNTQTTHVEAETPVSAV